MLMINNKSCFNITTVYIIALVSNMRHRSIPDVFQSVVTTWRRRSGGEPGVYSTTSRTTEWRPSSRHPTYGNTGSKVKWTDTGGYCPTAIQHTEVWGQMDGQRWVLSYRHPTYRSMGSNGRTKVGTVLPPPNVWKYGVKWTDKGGYCPPANLHTGVLGQMD
jgi:hypothetical protein